MYKDHSLVHLLNLNRRLKAVLDLLRCIARDGFTLSRGFELHFQWLCILRHGSSGPLSWDDLDMRPEVGLDLFSLRGLLVLLVGFRISFRRLLSIVEILLFGAGGIGYWRTHLYTRSSGFVLTLFPSSRSSAVTLALHQVGREFWWILLKLMNYFGRLGYLSSAEAPGVMRILMPSGGLQRISHPWWTRWSCFLSLVTCSVREFTGKSPQLVVWMVGGLEGFEGPPCSLVR